jgi:putative transposase
VAKRYPKWGYRLAEGFLRSRGWGINRKRVQRLMRVMGLEGVAPRPHTNQPHPTHARYPYLLRDLVIDRPNQLWCTDITLSFHVARLLASGGHFGLV